MRKRTIPTIMDLAIRKKIVHIDKQKIRKVLVLRLGAIGDVIRTTPMLRELRRMLPDARIDYLVNYNIKEVLEGNPNIDRIIGLKGQIYGRSFKTLKTFYNAEKEIRKEKYGLLINLEPHYLSQMFALLCNIPIAIGWDRLGGGFALNNKVKYEGTANEIEKALEVLKFIGRYRKKTDLEIYLSKGDEAFARRSIKSKGIKRKKVVMSPSGTRNAFASETQRRWPAEKYKELAERLIECGFLIIFVGDKYDKGVIKEVSKNLKKEDYIDTSGRTTIKQMAAIIKECDLFISHDSGPMHIAAAVQTPIIALFGPTNPRRAAPMTKNTHVIYKKKKNEPEQYNVYGCYINKKKDYINRITVDEVLYQAKLVLKH